MLFRSPVDIPFIELTDDEDCDIDGGNVADDEVSDEYSTNTCLNSEVAG